MPLLFWISRGICPLCPLDQFLFSFIFSIRYFYSIISILWANYFITQNVTLQALTFGTSHYALVIRIYRSPSLPFLNTKKFLINMPIYDIKIFRIKSVIRSSSNSLIHSFDSVVPGAIFLVWICKSLKTTKNHLKNGFWSYFRFFTQILNLNKVSQNFF